MGRESRNNPNVGAPRSTAILDARRRPLQEGDELILAVQGPLYFRIAQIAPNLHPQAPPGMMTVHLMCAVAFASMQGQINPEFVRVRTAEEAGPSNVVLLDTKDNPEGGALSVLPGGKARE